MCGVRVFGHNKSREAKWARARICERSGAPAERLYFLQSGECLSEDYAPLAQYAQRRSLSPKCPLVIASSRICGIG